MHAPDTRAHSLPALLIPEDYRARAVALHARELILRSPQMSAIALGGLSAGSVLVLRLQGERPPVRGELPQAAQTLRVPRTVDYPRTPTPQ